MTENKRCPLKMMGYEANPDPCLAVLDLSCELEDCQWWRPETAVFPADCAFVRIDIALSRVGDMLRDRRS